MTQQDITITDGEKNLGSIWNNILQKHSKFIQVSNENIKNFNKKLITSIDIKNINSDYNIFKAYVFKFEEDNIEWTTVFDIINGQNIFMKLCSFNKMKESTYVSMLIALIMSRYFLMTSLTSFCEKHLSKFKKNVMIININYEEVKALQFTATTVKKYSGLLIKNKHTIKIIRNIYKIFKKIEIEYNKKTYEELKELSYNDGWHDDMLDYIIVDKNGVSLQSTETVPYYVQCVDDTYKIETTVDYSIIKSPSYEDIIKSPSYEDIINTPTTLNLAKFIEIFINLIGCDMLNKFDSKIDDIIPMIEKLNNDNNDSDEDSDKDDKN